MCGIVGFSGDFRLQDLDSAISAIAHRGPDDSGIFKDDLQMVGLGHTRLSIIDLSGNAHQPMLSEDKSIVIIFNGEIYNFKDLKLDLKNKNYDFKSQSDTEVILKLYIDEGIKFLRKLKGIFSLAIYDKNNGNIYLVRDNIGIKPIYYHLSDKGIIFSSEIKAINEFLIKNDDIDYKAIQKYLTFLWCPGDETPILSIKKVLPGECIVINSGKVSEKFFWYNLPQISNSRKFENKDSAIKYVRENLETAVKRQLVSDVPIGGFLSGGIDSSSVIAIAKKYKNIECFTIRPEGGTDNDTTNDLPYAEYVAKYLNVNLNIIDINSHNIREDIEKMIWHLDEPLADPAALNVYYIAKAAKKMGIKVLLSGTGGDDIFTGYRRHIAANYENLFSSFPIKLSKVFENIGNKLDKRNSYGRRISKLFENLSLRGNDKLISYFKWANTDEIFKLFNSEVQDIIRTEIPERPMIDYLNNYDASTSSINKMLLLEQRFFLADHNLLYTDKMSMAEGVEVRVPFLDIDLIESASNISSNLKQRGITGKWILKEAVKPYLPKKIIYRKKSGFGAPLRRWMRKDLREMVSEYLSEQNLKNSGLFNYRSVSTLIEKNDKGIQDAAYTLFSILCIEIWYRKFVK